MSKQAAPLSLRISPELNRRLQECARRLKQKKHALAQAAVEAAVEAIEKNDYRLVIPMRFDISEVPVRKAAFPPYRPQRSELNEPRPRQAEK